MDDCRSEKNMKSPRKSLRDSRLMVFALITILTLAILYVVSTITIALLTSKALEQKSNQDLAILVQTISNYIHIDVAVSIGTIATAVCARYLARETTANITGNEVNRKYTNE